MTDDPRCCGTGTCIINAEGQCWCGQQWDGTKMCHPPLKPLDAFTPTAAPAPAPAAGAPTSRPAG